MWFLFEIQLRLFNCFFTVCQEDTCLGICSSMVLQDLLFLLFINWITGSLGKDIFWAVPYWVWVTVSEVLGYREQSRCSSRHWTENRMWRNAQVKHSLIPFNIRTWSCSTLRTSLANRYSEFSTESSINTEFSNAMLVLLPLLFFPYSHLNTAFCFLLSFEIWFSFLASVTQAVTRIIKKAQGVMYWLFQLPLKLWKANSLPLLFPVL